MPVIISVSCNMQAKLPDVNAAIVRHRSQALEGVRLKDFEMAIISLAAINALLPEDFKVEVNSSKYNNIVKERSYVTCGFCTTKDTNPKSETFEKELPTECVLSDVEQYDLELDWKEQILVGEKTERIWICNKCGKPNIMDINNIEVEKYQQPFFCKVMPSPPTPKRGIQGRNSFENEFKQWFSIAIQELEAQISRYRTEYAAQESDAKELNED